MTDRLTEDEKRRARKGETFTLVKDHHHRVQISIKFSFSVVESYREGWEDAKRLVLRGQSK